MIKSFSNNSLLSFYRWQDAPWQKSFNLVREINPSCFLKKVTASLCITGLLLINIPIFNAYEAHVIGVTSYIKNPIADHLVINKIYYDVDEIHGTEEDNEWVELYNPTDEGINIRGWQICDNKVCVSLSTVDLIIPAKSFAIISRSASTWNYWHIPNDVIEIVLANPSLFYLSNVSDMLLLKDSFGSIIDQMNWGVPDENWTNYNDELWNPGCVDVPEGHLLGRFPNGYDTDKVSDFKEFVPPAVSVIYPNGGSLHCGQNIDIKWQATNPNGPDDDLVIDIIYITDNDNSKTITPGDNSYLIADNIANTGIFNWTLAPCYCGYVWIKIIAVGPENCMINNSAVSPPVYEPPAPESLSTSGTSDIPLLPLEPDIEISEEAEDSIVQSQDQDDNKEQQLDEEKSQDTKLIAPDNPPKAPQGLAVEYKEGKAFLTWQINQERDLVGYNVYRKKEGASYEKINTFLIEAPEYIDSNIEAGEVYYYQIKAVDEAGQESEASLEVEINIPAAKPEFADEKFGNNNGNDNSDNDGDVEADSDGNSLAGSPPSDLPVEN